jgi:flagellar hook-associated protein 2
LGGGTTAANLNIAGSVAATTIKSGDLHRRIVGENTTLNSLNGGEGVPTGIFKITDKAGVSATLNVSGLTFKNLGDVLEAINASAVAVTAEINSTGDGILLTDTSGGAGTLSVEEQGGGKTAAALGIKGSGTSTIDGVMSTKITLDADDTLTDLVVKFATASSAGVTASIFNTGGPQGFRVMLSAKRSGDTGRVLIDSGTTNLDLTQSQAAQDAVLQLNGSGAAPVMFSSFNNSFINIVTGLSINVTATSTSPVTVSVADNGDSLMTAIDSFVAGYNSLSTTLGKQTAFDSTTTAKGTLQGDRVAGQLQEALGGMVGRVYGPSDNAVRNFAQLGVTIKGGQLSFDESVFQKALSENADAVRKFFNDTTNGAASFLRKSVDAFTASGTGTLMRRIDSLDTQSEDIQKRIDTLNASVEAKRQRILNQFLTLEKTLTLLKNQQNSLASLTSALENARAYNNA